MGQGASLLEHFRSLTMGYTIIMLWARGEGEVMAYESKEVSFLYLFILKDS